MPYGYPSVLESFQLGAKTSPAAGIGDAIRGIVNQHDKMAMMAGKAGLEARVDTAALGQMGGGMSPLGQPEIKEQDGQKFYKKPQWHKGRRVGFQWSPISQNMWTFAGGGGFNDAFNTGAGAGDDVGGTGDADFRAGVTKLVSSGMSEEEATRLLKE